MIAELRCLTVRQPWAWAIVRGGKDVENRVLNVAGRYRGAMAVHAGLELDLEGVRDERIAAAIERFYAGGTPRGTEGGRQRLGFVIGLVDLVDVHAGWIEATPCSPWAQRYADHVGLHHLVLANPRPLVEPVRARGRLGLWRPDDELAAAIWEQVAT